MFGRKQNKILELEASLAREKKWREEDVKYYKGGTAAARANEDQQKIRADKLNAELYEALASVRGYEGQVEAFTEDLVREREISQALADENRDLVRRLELLQSLLKQLNISIKFPARAR